MKKILVSLATIIGLGAQAVESEKTLPPVPKWKPEFNISVAVVLDRMTYYTDNEKDIVIFKNGTSVILPDDLSDNESKQYASEVLSQIFNYHPDMNPINMDDGNILVRYNHPAYNVVVKEFADKYSEEIEKNHLDGLATSEVLITPLGNNIFDSFGMRAIYGRTFMFMDAQNPEIVVLYRHKSANNE